MSRKQEHSLEALKAINVVKSYKDELITNDNGNNNYIIEYRSKNYPDFYFKIVYYEKGTSSKVVFKCQYKPYSSVSVSDSTLNISAENIDDFFQGWLSLIKAYDEVQDPFESEEDKFDRAAREEVYKLFSLDDEDADEVSYSTREQLLLDKYLDNTLKLLERNKNDDNEQEINVIVEEVKILKENQGKLTKKKVVEHISSFVAKTKKVSFSLFKEVLKDLIKEGLKDITFNGGNGIKALLENIS